MFWTLKTIDLEETGWLQDETIARPVSDLWRIKKTLYWSNSRSRSIDYYLPFNSMHCAKKSSICCVPTVSIDGWGKCNRSDSGTSCKSSQPTKTTHSSTIWKISVCLLKNSVNSFMCCPENQNSHTTNVIYHISNCCINKSSK